MEAFWVSLATVGVAEVGDRSMLMALLLGLRNQRPWAIFFGMALGLVANQLLAGILGVVLFSWFQGNWHHWVMGGVFILMAIWVAMPEDEDEAVETKSSSHGAFIAAAITFFIAEMADKTQLAVVALAGTYQQLFAVVAGASVGMLLITGPALWFGNKFAAHLPIQKIKYLGAVMFVIFGLLAFATASGLLAE